jgi:DNA-binding transcriptional regulator GbsR (MarR family)
MFLKINFQKILKVQKVLYLCVMEIQTARTTFIETWGNLGSSWGINRSVAQIQAYLLLAPGPVSTDELMENLQISRGNTNMSLRQLMDFGVVYKKNVPGERKEFFIHEKDIWKWAPKIMAIRKQRELNPVLEVLTELKEFSPATLGEEPKSPEAMELENTFVEQVNSIQGFSSKVSKVADKLCSPKSEMLLKLFKLFA